MKVQINIECETVAEFISHLIVLQRTAMREARRLKMDSDGITIRHMNLDDGNCYGSHEVFIIED